MINYYRDINDNLFKDTDINRIDQVIIDRATTVITGFVDSEEKALLFEPTNSYRRRLLHKLGSHHGLSSHSVGEGENRAVCLLKSSNEQIPANLDQLDKVSIQPDSSVNTQENHEKPERITPPNPALVDRGSQIFYSKPGVEIILRNDGSFGVGKSKGASQEILDRRKVENGMFKIRKSRIVCAKDPEWYAIS